MMRLIALVLALLTALPAGATPPRYASVLDLPIAISRTHLYLLRSISDNEGSYFIRTTRRLLVAQNLETGAAERFWPIDVTRETFDDGASPGGVEFTDTRGPGDILALLRAEGAVPVSVGPILGWGDDAEARLQMRNPYRLDETGLVRTGSGGAAPLIPRAALEAQVQASLGPVLAAVPVDPGPAGPLDLGAEPVIRDPVDCTVMGLEANSSPYALFLLACENGDFSLSGYQIYLTQRRE